MKKRMLLLGLLVGLMVFAFGVASASAEVTWNPSDKGSAVTLSNGNLTTVISSRTNGLVRATEGKSSGKWYWEVTINAGGTKTGEIGIADIQHPTSEGCAGWETGAYHGVSIDQNPGDVVYQDGTYSLINIQINPGDVVGVALDLDNNLVTFYLNGAVYVGNLPCNNLTKPVFPCMGAAYIVSNANTTTNFGATVFQHTIPAGYLSYDGSQAGVPTAPTNLSAIAGDSQVSLSWTAVTEATSYKVKRATATGGPYTEVAGSVTAASYTDTTVSNGTTYYYVVSAVNAAGEGGNSSEVSASPQAAAPGTPANLAATSGSAQVTLKWDTVSGATSYIVRRATVTGGPYTDVATGLTTCSYSDTTVTNGTTYYYVVAAVTSGGTSANSNQASATPQAVATSGNGTLIITMNNGPDKEYNLTMTQIEAFISWYNNRSTGGYYYIIEKPASGAYASIKDYLIFDKIVCWEVKEY